MAVALGGRVAEEIMYGEDEVTTGASNDLERVASTAKMMVTRFGMSERVGQVRAAPSPPRPADDRLGREGGGVLSCGWLARAAFPPVCSPARRALTAAGRGAGGAGAGRGVAVPGAVHGAAAGADVGGDQGAHRPGGVPPRQPGARAHAHARTLTATPLAPSTLPWPFPRLVPLSRFPGSVCAASAPCPRPWRG